MPSIFSELKRMFSPPITPESGKYEMQEIPLSLEAQAAIRLVESFDPLKPALTPETVLSNVRAILDLGFTLSTSISIKSAQHQFSSWEEGGLEPIEFSYDPESKLSPGNNTLVLKNGLHLGATSICISQPPSLHRSRINGPENFLPIIADSLNNDWNRLSKPHLLFMLKCIENNLRFICSEATKRQIIDFIGGDFK